MDTRINDDVWQPRLVLADLPASRDFDLLQFLGENQIGSEPQKSGLLPPSTSHKLSKDCDLHILKG